MLKLNSEIRPIKSELSPFIGRSLKRVLVYLKRLIFNFLSPPRLGLPSPLFQNNLTKTAIDISCRF